VRVTLYHSPGCHLCDDAREVLAAVGAERPFELEEIDITGDDRLERTTASCCRSFRSRAGSGFCWFVPADAFRRALDAQTGS
jgi:hypothetical protein